LGIEGYSHQLSMQRFFSILAIIAILCPVASPLWASAAPMAYGSSCHRMPMETAGTTPSTHEHHCHEMAAEQTKVPAEGNGPVLASSAGSEKCPMNCCLQSVPPTAVLPTGSPLPLLHAAKFQLHSLAVIFRTAGFSSHTDRGPPSFQA
jgi:hypothetical protein